MDGSKCICQVRGVRPFFSNKFDITKHTNYKKLADYNEKDNTFNIEKYLSQEVTFTANEETTVHDCGEIKDTEIA